MTYLEITPEMIPILAAPSVTMGFSAGFGDVIQLTISEITATTAPTIGPYIIPEIMIGTFSNVIRIAPNVR